MPISPGSDSRFKVELEQLLQKTPSSSNRFEKQVRSDIYKLLRPEEYYPSEADLKKAENIDQKTAVSFERLKEKEKQENEQQQRALRQAEEYEKEISRLQAQGVSQSKLESYKSAAANLRYLAAATKNDLWDRANNILQFNWEQTKGHNDGFFRELDRLMRQYGQPKNLPPRPSVPGSNSEAAPLSSSASTMDTKHGPFTAETSSSTLESKSSANRSPQEQLKELLEIIPSLGTGYEPPKTDVLLSASQTLPLQNNLSSTLDKRPSALPASAPIMNLQNYAWSCAKEIMEAANKNQTLSLQQWQGTIVPFVAREAMPAITALLNNEFKIMWSRETGSAAEIKAGVKKLTAEKWKKMNILAKQSCADLERYMKNYPGPVLLREYRQCFGQDLTLDKTYKAVEHKVAQAESSKDQLSTNDRNSLNNVMALAADAVRTIERYQKTQSPSAVSIATINAIRKDINQVFSNVANGELKEKSLDNEFGRLCFNLIKEANRREARHQTNRQTGFFGGAFTRAFGKEHNSLARGIRDMFAKDNDLKNFLNTQNNSALKTEWDNLNKTLDSPVAKRVSSPPRPRR